MGSRRQSDCPEYPPAVAPAPMLMPQPAPMPMQQGTPAWIIPIYILMGLLLLVGVITVLGLTFGWFNSGSQTRQAQVRAQKRKRSTGAKQTREDLQALHRGVQTRTRGTKSKPRCIDGLELPEMCRGTMIGATLCVAIIINALILFLVRKERQKREMAMMWGGYGQPQV